jgi:hypothetical protein
MIRGLVWTQWYFGPNWFEDHSEDDDGSRGIETEDNGKLPRRAARVLYLGMTLARRSGSLVYDRETKCFSTADDVSAVVASVLDANDFVVIRTANTTGEPRSPPVDDGDSSADSGDYVVVPKSTRKVSRAVSRAGGPRDGAAHTDISDCRKDPLRATNTNKNNGKTKDQYPGDVRVKIAGDDTTE